MVGGEITADLGEAVSASGFGRNFGGRGYQAYTVRA